MSKQVYITTDSQIVLRQFIADYHISIIPQIGNLTDEHKQINSVLDGIFQKIQQCSNAGQFTIEIEPNEFTIIRRAMYLSRLHQRTYVVNTIDSILTQYDNRYDRN
ncbi:MAG: hypothetical protein EOM76_07190 [Sphingobacteriia bacterium]|nr:hypothetical protein [Sphingobacteriia bacterium]